MSTVWGATPEEWRRVAGWGITADLLPVVSNPAAKVSPKSKLRGIGKVPSRYDRERQVVGIAEWPQHRSTEVDIARWQRDGDLGICVQTRDARAIDIDIDDPAAAQRVRDAVELTVGALPVRAREGTGKCLLAFRMAGEHSKRILRTERGIIEFLGNGQQFVAVGTHPSGTRYAWEGGLPDELPWLTADEFEALWQALFAAFALSGVATSAAVTLAKARRAGDAADPLLAWLEERGLIHSMDRQGRAHITCPWAHEHTTGPTAGDTSTTYLPRGVGGFSQGHFHCLHAHCAERTDGDFIDALGYVMDDFSIVEAGEGEDAAPEPLPPFQRARSGEIHATVRNLSMALRRPDVAGVEIRYDAFTDDIMLAPHKTREWRAFSDPDYTRLRERLEGVGFKSIGRETIRDVVGLVADEERFDSAQLWLSELRWDGTPRVERFFVQYFAAEDTDYARSVSLYTWTALAGRVLSPGVKADMVPILIGEQGAGKSTGVAAMVPAPEHFMELRLDDDEIEIARRMRGKLVAEIGELRGLHTREIEHIKAFVTRTHEEWIPKYREFATKFPRRLVFVGTTNSDEFLDDPTGNRRFLPLRTGRVDVDGIARDREQLWAEAAALFTAHGVAWDQAEELATEVHEEHSVTDPWTDAVLRWLDSPADALDAVGLNRDRLFRMSELLQGGLGMTTHQLARKDELRAGRILRGLGYMKTRLWDGPLRVKVWGRVEICELRKSERNDAFGGAP